MRIQHKSFRGQRPRNPILRFLASLEMTAHLVGNGRKGHIKWMAVLLCVAILTSGCATIKVHPEFNKRHENMKSLLLLPPDVKAFEITFNAGNKPLKELMDSMEANSTETIKAVMEEKGYQLTAVTLRQEDLDSNPALKDAFFELRKLFEQAVADIKANKKKEFTYELGSAGNYFAEKHNVNALILVREVGTRLSSGMTASQVASATLSVATVLLTGIAVGGGIQPQFGLGVEIAIIDADLGYVLWYNLKESSDNFNNPSDKKTVTKYIRDTLAAFPDSKFKSATAKAPPKKEEKTVPAKKPLLKTTVQNFSPTPPRTPATKS